MLCYLTCVCVVFFSQHRRQAKDETNYRNKSPEHATPEKKNIQKKPKRVVCFGVESYLDIPLCKNLRHRKKETQTKEGQSLLYIAKGMEE